MTQAPSPDPLPRRQLLPGDPGYAPPARVAQPAGVPLADLGFERGHSAASPPPLPVKPQPAVIATARVMRPAMLSAVEARTRLQVMVHEFGRWILDLPYATTGEAAVVVKFFRELEARREAHATAEVLGRPIAPDAIEQACHQPPPEFFTLRHVAQQLQLVVHIYETMLVAAGLTLPGKAAEMVEAAVAETLDLARGPSVPPPGAQA